MIGPCDLRRAWLAVLVVPVLALSACGEADTEGSAAPPVAEFVATDFGYEGPSELPAGLTEMRLENRGEEIHQIQLVKLDEGSTIEDLGAALEANPEAQPEFATLLGGPNGAMPGATVNAYVALEEGSYAMLCIVPSPDGTLHVEKGMIQPLTVIASDATSASAPEADIVVEGRDFTFIFPDEISAGQHTIRFDNTGEQAHEIVVVKLDEGASIEDFAAAFGPDAPPGPPPGYTVAGTVGLASGLSQSFDVEFEEGRYALICFLPDPGTGAPHFMLGMSQEFDVG